MDKDKALQMCLEYIETDAEKDAHERKYVRLAIKQALAAPVQPVAWFKHGPYEDGEPLSVVFENPHDDVCYSPLGFIEPPTIKPAPVQDASKQFHEWAVSEHAAQPAPVQAVACAVCNEVHAIFDADESKIIRDAKDGYPEGRTPRTLTLQERVNALCKYASDWKRWCLEKENTTPPAEPAAGVGLTDVDLAEAGGLTVEGPRMLPYAFARAIEARLREKNGGAA